MFSTYFFLLLAPLPRFPAVYARRGEQNNDRDGFDANDKNKKKKKLFFIYGFL